MNSYKIRPNPNAPTLFTPTPLLLTPSSHWHPGREREMKRMAVVAPTVRRRPERECNGRGRRRTLGARRRRRWHRGGAAAAGGGAGATARGRPALRGGVQGLPELGGRRRRRRRMRRRRSGRWRSAALAGRPRGSHSDLAQPYAVDGERYTFDLSSYQPLASR